jgi:hypothetical protein
LYLVVCKWGGKASFYSLLGPRYTWKHMSTTLRKSRGYSTPKILQQGCRLGSAKPGGQPNPDGPPPGLSSSGRLTYGPWCWCSMICALAHPFGIVCGPLNPCANLWLVGGVFLGLLSWFAMGPSCKCNAECDLLCILLHFVYTFYLFPLMGACNS